MRRNSRRYARLGSGSRPAAAALATLLVLAACSSAGHDPTAAPSTTGATGAAPTTAHPAPAAASLIAWSKLKNPLYGEPDHAVKDPALVAFGGGWVLLFSRVDTKGEWRVGIARSRDLASWSPATTLPRDPDTEGEASPDVVRAPDGTFVVTYQSFVHDRDGAQAKLYARGPRPTSSSSRRRSACSRTS